MDWSCEYSIKGLSSSVKRCFQERANFLHFDMGTRKYKGVLVDLPYTKFHSGQKGRSTESRNPVWYSEFYWRNTPHTEIKYSNKIKRSRIRKTLDRGRISMALKRISDAEDKNYRRYHVLMREVVLDSLIDGVPFDDFDIGSQVEVVGMQLSTEPSNDVRLFFGRKKIETYGDELLEFRKKYGDIGEQVFFRKYEKGDLFNEFEEVQKIRDDEVPF